MIDWGAISAEISLAVGIPFKIARITAQDGGCINRSYRVGNLGGLHYFVKLNHADKLPMFAAEMNSLRELAASDTIRVPQPITCGVCSAHSFLVLEYLELNDHGDEALLGTQLAQLHLTHSSRFGWHQDNTIGATTQRNNWSGNWIVFWREHRLGYQLELAKYQGLTDKLQPLGEQLLSRLDKFFVGYHPAPSLLHGDLWSGNHGYAADGTPVLFDPAPYYGDRETDLAMTELFGGFNSRFYAAYRAGYPLHPGYESRRDLYNLYHILNHANLFGGNYPQQAVQMMQRLLRHLD